MIKLYHMPLSPASRKIRLLLGEKRLETDLIEERPWDGRSDFLMLNPAGKVPVININGIVIAESGAIFEYIEESFPNPPMLPQDRAMRAEARRLMHYFDDKFYHEVSKKILHERVYRRLARDGYPDSVEIKSAMRALKFHYGYMDWLLEERRWLAGDQMTIADFAAAAHFSSLDYLGDIDWAIIPNVKEWYSKVKSRPAFRSLLADLVPNVRPTRQYADLDF